MALHDDDEDEDEEIRVRRIRKKKKKKEGQEGEQGGGRLREFFRNLGPALSAMQLPDPNQAVGPVPQSGLGSILSGLNLGGQSFIGAKDAIAEADQNRAIKNLRNSPAFSRALAKMNAGIDLSANDTTVLNLGLADKFQGKTEAFGQAEARRAGETQAGVRPKVEDEGAAADRTQRQPAVDAQVANTEATTANTKGATALQQQAADATTTQATAALNQSVASLEQTKAAIRSAATDEERTKLVGRRVTIEQQQQAELIKSNFINKHPTADPIKVGLAIEAYAMLNSGLSKTQLSPEQQEIMAVLPRVPAETIAVRRDNQFKISNDFVNRMEKLATLYYEERGEDVPRRVQILISRLGIPNVLLDFARGESQARNDMQELQELIGAGPEASKFWSNLSEEFIGLGSALMSLNSKNMEEDMNNAFDAGEAAEESTGGISMGSIRKRLRLKSGEKIKKALLTDEELKFIQSLIE